MDVCLRDRELPGGLRTRDNCGMKIEAMECSLLPAVRIISFAATAEDVKSEYVAFHNRLVATS